MKFLHSIKENDITTSKNLKCVTINKKSPQKRMSNVVYLVSHLPLHYAHVHNTTTSGINDKIACGIANKGNKHIQNQQQLERMKCYELA